MYVSNKSFLAKVMSSLGVAREEAVRQRKAALRLWSENAYSLQELSQ